MDVRRAAKDSSRRFRSASIRSDRVPRAASRWSSSLLRFSSSCSCSRAAAWAASSSCSSRSTAVILRSWSRARLASRSPIAAARFWSFALSRPKLSNLDEEIHLLLLQLSLQFLQRRRFLGERPLLSLHLAGAAFELGLLRLMFPQEGRLAGLQVLHGRGLRIRAMAQSELSGLRRLLALLEVLLAAIQVGFPLGEVPSERLGRPDSILKRLFGAEEFRRLFLQAASGFLNLFHGPGGLASLP